MPTQDLRCPVCEITTENVYYRMSEGFPACPDCGAQRRVDWSHGLAPAVHGHGYGSFTPIDMGVLGKAETKEDYDRMKSVIQQRFPGHRIELESETKGQKKARLDAVRHARFERHNKLGITGKAGEEGRAEATAKKAEARQAAESKNLPPPKPKKPAVTP
jgi:hypothetical protein